MAMFQACILEQKAQNAFGATAVEIEAGGNVVSLLPVNVVELCAVQL